SAFSIQFDAAKFRRRTSEQSIVAEVGWSCTNTPNGGSDSYVALGLQFARYLVASNSADVGRIGGSTAQLASTCRHGGSSSNNNNNNNNDNNDNHLCIWEG